MISNDITKLKSIQNNINEYWGILKIDLKQARIRDIQLQMNNNSFWDNKIKSNDLIKELNTLNSDVSNWVNLRKEVDEYLELALLMQFEESNFELEESLTSNVSNLSLLFDKLSLSIMLNGKDDNKNVFISITAGAGGMESCDWVNMLYRMYTMWCDKNKYKYKIIDILYLDNPSLIKSVTLHIQAKNIYGLLKCEAGIHRLVRISPFDIKKRRHTSFASVHVSPDIDDDITIQIAPSDIRIDTYKSQGAGGQHVNTTDSAVRITHIATNIVAQCQKNRSQHKNKEDAMKVLKSRLYELYQSQKRDELNIDSDKPDISWGNQIRSYIFNPYIMIKDHRTKLELFDGQGMLDGKYIDKFIYLYLKGCLKS